LFSEILPFWVCQMQLYNSASRAPLIWNVFGIWMGAGLRTSIWIMWASSELWKRYRCHSMMIRYRDLSSYLWKLSERKVSMPDIQDGLASNWYIDTDGGSPNSSSQTPSIRDNICNQNIALNRGGQLRPGTTAALVQDLVFQTSGHACRHDQWTRGLHLNLYSTREFERSGMFGELTYCLDALSCQLELKETGSGDLFRRDVR